MILTSEPVSYELVGGLTSFSDVAAGPTEVPRMSEGSASVRVMGTDDRVPAALAGDCETSSSEVQSVFLVTDAAEKEYEGWKGRQDRARVHPQVEKHVTRALYRVSPDDIRDVCKETLHALGNVQKDTIKGIKEAENWNPDFAFTHLFHFQLEQIGHIPTWQEFAEFHLYEPRGWWFFGRQATDHCRTAARERGLSVELVWDAMRWRVGNAYYGILRDVYTVVGLRARGIDVRSHPLADALFRVDAWVGQTVLNIYVVNPLYRSGYEGRKKPSQDLLQGAHPEFKFHNIILEAATQFGVVHLPTKEELDGAAQKLTDLGHASQR
jgi:hypothetical protein